MSWTFTVLPEGEGLWRVTVLFAGQVYATEKLRLDPERVEFLKEALAPLFEDDVHAWLDAWRKEART